MLYLFCVYLLLWVKRNDLCFLDLFLSGKPQGKNLRETLTENLRENFRESQSRRGTSESSGAFSISPPRWCHNCNCNCSLNEQSFYLSKLKQPENYVHYCYFAIGKMNVVTMDT